MSCKYSAKFTNHDFLLHSVQLIFQLSLNFALQPILFSINHIKLIQYRNYASVSYNLDARVIAVVGQNGIGKTNLLDAIYSLGFTKSYFGKSDGMSVQHGMMGFNVTGIFDFFQETKEISLVLRENNKKELTVNKIPVVPFSSHIGKFPLVFIAPDDVELINGGSEGRRRLIDTILSQTDHEYLIHLIRYNKTLADRNKYLKQAAFNGQTDHLLIDSFDSMLVSEGKPILEKRSAQLMGYISTVLDLYAFISDDNERPSINYVSGTSASTFEKDLANARQKDMILQRTTVGAHRDDLEIFLGDAPFKQVASQGQKKSMLFSLKLAEFSLLNEHFKFPPILLLDDIFEKLDQQRLEKLLDWVCIKNDGQVILTDTHEDRVQKSLANKNVPFKLIKI